jgi:hypothetical protein
MTSRANYESLTSYKWLEEEGELDETASVGSSSMFD